jgi:hypothetical protein
LLEFVAAFLLAAAMPICMRIGGMFSSPLVVNGIVYLAAPADFSTGWNNPAFYRVKRL